MIKIFETHRAQRSIMILVNSDGMWLHALDTTSISVINCKITGYPKHLITACEKVLSEPQARGRWQIQTTTSDGIYGEVCGGVMCGFSVEEIKVTPEGFPSTEISLTLRPEEVENLIKVLEDYWTI